MALGERTGELHPALFENGVVGVIPAVFRVEIPTAPLQSAKLHGANRVVQSAERGAGPIRELPGSVIEAIPGGKVIIVCAGGLREAGKAAAVEHQKLSGLGDREEQQLSVLRGAIR